MIFDASKTWHYVANGQAVGPVTGEDIRRLAASGSIGRETKIWTSGLSEWIDAGSFSDLFANRPPAYAPPVGAGAPAYAQSPGYTPPPNYGSQVNSPYMAATGQLGAMGQAEVHYAGFWIRVVAYVIDGIILSVLGWVAGLLLGATGIVPNIDYGALATMSEAQQAQVTANYIGAIGPFYGLFTLLAILYFVILHASRKQATWGKQIVGIHLMRADGSKVGFGRSLGRYFAMILSSLILGIGFLMAGWTHQKKALHDMICDTRVVYGRL